MIDESKYPTLKYYVCKVCGYVFASSVSGNADCPECKSYETNVYRPDKTSEGDDRTESKQDENSAQ